MRFTGNCCGEIVRGWAYWQSRCRIAGLFEILKMPVSMAGFALGGRTKYDRDVVVALDVRFCCKVQVTAIRL